MGALPSHPELLDWLARRFLESGGSLKSLHRLIVTSAAYRQSVRHDATFAAIDGDNQWLWRQNRRRLDAESVHDAILAVAGQLDRTMGGPSVQQFSLRPGVHVTPVRRLQPVRLEQPRLAPAQRLSLPLPHAARPVLRRPRFGRRLATDGRAQRVDHAAAGPRALEQPVRPPPVRGSSPATRERNAGAISTSRSEPRSSWPTAAGGRRRSRAALGLRRRHGLVNLCRLIVNSNEFLYVN